MEYGNNEFDDFSISEDEEFFYGEDEDEEINMNISKLMVDLKQLLKISDPTKSIAYPYDNLDY